jgi:transcriptional regulator with XRE-family HTH domain
MKRRAGDRFQFKPQLGERLRELRLQAGLTQQMLAVAMGSQCKGNHAVVPRLERGRLKNPGIGLVADYLRACRAGFKDILSVLDRYTSQSTVVEVETEKAMAKVREHLPPSIDNAVLNYDIKTESLAETKLKPPPAPAERVKRARNFGLSQVWAVRVRRKVVSIIETKHFIPGPVKEQHLQDYAAKVWRVLNLTRGKRTDKRPAMLDEAIRPYLGEGGPKHEHLEAIRDGLLNFFHESEIAGELDARP